MTQFNAALFEKSWVVDEAKDWHERVIHKNSVGAASMPPWFYSSYMTLREQVLDPAYPCYFGTLAERRGEMFYSFVEEDSADDLPETMKTFTELASRGEFKRYNFAVFFEPDETPLAHDTYRSLFWNVLQRLHDADEHSSADSMPSPSAEEWEFSFGGVEMFVVCACPSFKARRSRNLGPGMVLLFQPRSVFIDTITNHVINREARDVVRNRLARWDAIGAHPDLGFYGDPGNLEWKQYFLEDDNTANNADCPFSKRRVNS